MEPKKSIRDMLHVNVKMIPVKVTYFLLLGALAALLPFLPVFMGVLKLTPIQMSIIMSTATAISAPIRLIIGYMADRFQKRNTVFAVAAALTVLFHIFIYFIPVDESLPLWQKDTDTQVKLCSRSDVIFLESFNKTTVLNNNITKFNSAIKCCLENQCIDLVHVDIDSLHFTVNNNISGFINNSLSHHGSSQTASESCINFQFCNRATLISESVDNSKTFWIFFVIFFFAQVAFAPLQNILDSLIYAFLKKSGKLQDFGKSRLWGTVGFGLFAFAAGVIQDTLSEIGWKGRQTYIVSFVTFSIGLLLAALTTILINVPMGVAAVVSETSNGDLKKDEARPESEVKPFKEDEGSSIFKDKKQILKIFCGFYLSVIILTGLVAGIMAGCIEGFFFYFLASLDPTNKSVIGISLAVSCACEVVVLFFSGKIVSLLGSKRCLYLTFVVFAARFVANSYIENPWYGLLTEASQCICFGLLYPIISSWASSLVPFALQSTVQCYLGAIYFSLGRAIGAGVAGTLYETLGPRTMFRVFAAIAGVYVVVLVVIFEVVDRFRLKKASQPTGGVDNDVKVDANVPQVSIKVDKGDNVNVTQF